MIYGEGRKAFIRLWEKIARQSCDLFSLEVRSCQATKTTTTTSMRRMNILSHALKRGTEDSLPDLTGFALLRPPKLQFPQTLPPYTSQARP